MQADINKIVNLMCEKKVNQKGLAMGSGVTLTTVSRLMRGKSAPTIETIHKIADFLGAEPGEIVKQEG